MPARRPVSRSNTRGYRTPDGEFFASRAEFNRWEWLRVEETEGRIRRLTRKKGARFEIVINGVNVGHYTADAVYQVLLPHGANYAAWTTVIEDTKGYDGLGRWRFRKKVIEAACGITITEVPASEWTDAAVAKRQQAALQERMTL